MTVSFPPHLRSTGHTSFSGEVDTWGTNGKGPETSSEEESILNLFTIIKIILVLSRFIRLNNITKKKVQKTPGKTQVCVILLSPKGVHRFDVGFQTVLERSLEPYVPKPTVLDSSSGVMDRTDTETPFD